MRWYESRKRYETTTREFFQILFPDTDRGMDVITSQSHYKQFMISRRWASRSRYGRNICFVSVPFYFFAITLFLAIALSTAVHATIAQSFHANVGRTVACVSRVSWHNEHVTESQNGGRRVRVCTHICQTARLWKRPRLLVGNIFALRCSKRTRRILRIVIFFVAIFSSMRFSPLQRRNWNEVSNGYSDIRSVRKSV